MIENYVDELFSDVCHVLRIRPIGVHVLNSPVNSIRIVSVIVTVDVFADLLVEELFRDRETRR